MATVAIASFIIILSVAVSSGFRRELRNGIASVSGDIRLTPPDLNYISDDNPVRSDASYIHALEEMDGIKEIVPVIYRAGIVKADSIIHGVLFKGVPDKGIPGSGENLSVSVPRRLSTLLGLKQGDRMLTYFVGDRVRARNFSIASVYDDVIGSDDKLVVYVGLSDLQRLNEWEENEVSAIELKLDDRFRSSSKMREMTQEVAAAVLFNTPEEEDTVVATSAASIYPEIFSWLDLIDFNVLFVLILMTLVAGFNMISSLLIMLFRNISVIGILKSVGMTDRAITSVFLRVASSVVLKGMLIGNALAFAFCLVQDKTHVVGLNPENYFVSAVPVALNVWKVIGVDAITYLVIMLLLLLPCLFVSGVDPAKTVRMQ